MARFHKGNMVMDVVKNFEQEQLTRNTLVGDLESKQKNNNFNEIDATNELAQYEKIRDQSNSNFDRYLEAFETTPQSRAAYNHICFSATLVSRGEGH